MSARRRYATGCALIAWLSCSGAVARNATAPTAAAATAPNPVPSRAIQWHTIAPGAARAEIAAGDESGGGALGLGFGAARVGAGKILLVRFDLRLFRPEVLVGAGRPPARQTATQVVRERGAAAAVNGGFFDERLIPLGLRISAGAKRVPLRARVDWGVLLFSKDGAARIVHTRDVAAAAAPSAAPPAGVNVAPATTGWSTDDDVRDAIQVGPRLLVDGAPLKLKPQSARRTAVALDRGGSTLTLVVTDFAIDANDLAARLAALGFHTALMLDGGPSTQLAVNLGATRLEIAGAYAVPDLLAIFSRPVDASVPAGAPIPPGTPLPRLTPRQDPTPSRP